LVTAQLQQILSYLDRDGVTELVFATNRAIAMRQNGAYVNLTARPLTLAMLTAFLDGTPLAALVPRVDASTEPTEVEFVTRRLRVRTGRRGDEVVVRVEPLPATASTASNGTPAAGAPPPSGSREKVAAAERTAPPNRDLRGAQALKVGLPPSPHLRDQTGAGAPGGGLDLGSPHGFSLELPGSVPVSLEPERVPPLTVDSAPSAAATPNAARSSPPHGRPHVSIAPAIPMTPFGQLVVAARAAGASDLHISAGRVVSIRKNAELIPLDPEAAPLSVEAVESLLKPLLEAEHEARIQPLATLIWR